ncbi:MAG: glucose-1-phosphate adenylyltransferase subunit GlgD [Clostridia bacterium]|nr:glucose-1-phosphate adenylyltransferase subunit GlgD [Clostridia bacterium]
MNNMMGLIYTNANEPLGELTSVRGTAALPVCARYRVIDFILSSLVSSGARNVGIIMQKNYHSLMEHLGSGKEWDLHGKHQGLAILPPFLTHDNVGVYAGFMDAVKSNLTYLRQSRERYVLVTETGMVYNARYDDMLKQHVSTGADVTLMYTDDPGVVRSGNSGRYLDVDVNGRVKDIEVEPSLAHYCNTFMECFLIRRELLIDLVDRALSRAQYHFVRDVLISALRDGSLKIYGWRNPGKVWKLDSVQAYFNCSMDLLKPEVRKELFNTERPVWGKQRDDMPTRYAPGAVVKNSLLADGCVIEGTVENSIIFRGVRVQKGAVVRNAIVMQDGYIMSNTELEGCVLDKGVIVREGTRLIAPATYPTVIGKNMII